jgi:hypothetical protein
LKFIGRLPPFPKPQIRAIDRCEIIPRRCPWKCLTPAVAVALGGRSVHAVDLRHQQVVALDDDGLPSD